MLELRPNCELCDIDLPVNSLEACICTYECTFCLSCVENKLNNVCPNCGGGFQARPIRPKKAYRVGVSVNHQKPQIKRIHTKFTDDEIKEFVKGISLIKPQVR
jgi:hypothetical protein